MYSVDIKKQSETIDNESILNSIKTLIGGIAEDDTFNDDLKMHINSIFSILNQLGVGPENGFYITGEDEKWSDFITGANQLSVKTYVFIRVKLIFDPPQSSYVADLMKSNADELEWRLTN